MFYAAGDLGLIELIRTPLLNEFFIHLTYLGSTVTALALIAGFYFLEDKELFRSTFAGLSTTYIIVHLLKLIFAIPRPETVTQLVNPATTYAFPSGHSAVAAVMAVIIGNRKEALKPYIYTLAAFICFSRFYLGVHYISDIIVGAAIGGLIGKAVIERENIVSKFRSPS